MFKNKRFLITQPIIRILGGSALVTLELAEYLTENGAKVIVYTCDYSEPAKSYFEKSGVSVLTAQENPDLKLTDFDYIWVHSQILPISIVEALSKKLPARMPSFIFLHMSGMDWLPDEKPWIFNLENRLSSLSLFISEEVKDVNSAMIDQDVRTAFFRNPAPSTFKNLNTTPNPTLKRLLIVSNHQPIEVTKAKDILHNQYNIDVTSLGENQEKYERFTDKILKKYDAVLTIAKTIPYCLVAGTPVYVYDLFAGGPGWLNAENFDEAKKRNFSGYQNSYFPNSIGGIFQKKNASQIAREVISGYKTAVDFHQSHRSTFYNDYLLENVLPKLLEKVKPRKIAQFSKSYTESIKNSELFATSKFELAQMLSTQSTSLAKTIAKADYLKEENRLLTDERNRLAADLQETKRNLQKITDSKYYKICKKLIQPYAKIKEITNRNK